MTTTITKSDAYLRQGFKVFNRFMLLMWRLGLGNWVNLWPSWGGRIMVLTHTGRMTGLRRRTPVNYAVVDGEIYCTAAFGTAADWHRNITADPRVEVWLPDGWWEGEAMDVSASPDRLALLRAVLIASGFAAYMAGLRPQTMSDDELDAATRIYRLVAIHRTAPRTGPGGPGDLTWVWPALVMGWLIASMLRRRSPER